MQDPVEFAFTQLKKQNKKQDRSSKIQATKIHYLRSRWRSGAVRHVYDNTLFTAPSQWADVQATQRLTDCGVVHTGQQIFPHLGNTAINGIWRVVRNKCQRSLRVEAYKRCLTIFNTKRVTPSYNHISWPFLTPFPVECRGQGLIIWHYSKEQGSNLAITNWKQMGHTVQKCQVKWHLSLLMTRYSLTRDTPNILKLWKLHSQHWHSNSKSTLEFCTAFPFFSIYILFKTRIYAQL